MAGKQLDVDKIQLEVTVDGSPARKELAETRQEVAKLKTEYGKLQQQEKELIVQRDAAKAKGDTSEYKRLKEELAKVRAEAGAAKASMDQLGEKATGLQKKLGAAGLSANELRSYLGRLKSELNAGVLSGTDEEVAKIREIEQLEARYKSLSTTLGRQRLLWEKDREGIDLDKMSLRQLGLELDRWEDIKSRSEPNTKEWAEADAAIKRVKDRTEELTSTQKRAEAQWEKDRHTVALTAASVEQLALEEKRLQAILANPNTSAVDRRKAAEDIKLVQDRTEQLTDANRIARDVWEQQRKEMKLVEMDVHQLGLEEQRLKAIINSPTTSDAERQQAARHLEAVTQRTKELTDVNLIAARAWETERTSIDRMDMSLEQLGKETARYKEIQRTAQPGSAAYTEATVGLAAVKDRTEQLTNATRMAADEWVKMRGKFKLEDMSIQQLKLEKQYLEELRNTLQRTDPALQKVEADFIAVDKALKNSTEQTALQERQWERMRGSLKLTDMSVEELEQEVKFLNAALARMKPNDTGLEKLRRDAQAAEAQLAKLKTGLGPFGQMWASIKTQMVGAGAVIGSLFAGGAIMQGLRSLVSSGAKVSDEFAEIQKVTGKTADEVKRLNTEISHIDTRTASTDLRGIAVGLGQAGQEVTGVAIAAIDKINLALGSEFGSSAKEITNTVSVLRNNLSDVKSGNYAEDVGKIGNAILVLGQSGLATAPVVSDIGNRIAGVARQFGVTSGQILGTAAAFQELGISTERGSTAYTKLLQKISTAPQAFADVVKRAGGNVEEFLRLVNTDMQSAFLMVAKSAKDAGSENTEFGAILKELETSGAGVSELLSKVGANTELFAQKARVATEALKDQNAINAQAKLANETLAAQIEKLGKEFNRVFTSTTVINGIKSVVAGLRELVNWVKENKDSILFLGKVLANATLAWVSYRVAVAASALVTRATAAVQAGYATVMAAVTGKIEGATVAQRLFNVVSKANPIGLIISAVTTGIALFASFGDEVNDARNALHGLSEEDRESQKSAQALYLQILQTKEGTQERVALIEKLKALYPGYLDQVDAETVSNNQLKRSLEAVNLQLIHKAQLQKVDDTVAAARNEAADAGAKFAAAEAATYDRISELAAKYKVDVTEATKGATSAWEQATLVRAALIQKQKEAGGDGFFQEQFDFDAAIAELGKYEGYAEKKNRIALRYAQVGEQEKAALTEKWQKQANQKELAMIEAEAAELKRRIVTATTEQEEEKIMARVRVLAARKQELLAAESAPGAVVTTTGSVEPPAVNKPAFDKATATLGQFNAEIKRLKKELLGVSDPAVAAGINDTIKDLEALRNERFNVGGDGGKKAEEQQAAHLATLKEELEKWRAETARDGLSADAKEIAELDAKHAEELKKVKAQHAELLAAKRIKPEEITSDLAALGEKQDRERNALLKKQEDERMRALKDTNARIQAALGEGHNAALQAEADALGMQLELAREGSREREELERQHNAALLRLYQANAEDALRKEGEKWKKLIEEAKKQVALLDERISTPGNSDQEEQQLLEQRRTLTANILALEKARNKGIQDINDKRRAEERSAEAKATLQQRQEFTKRIQAWAGVAQAVGSITSAIQQNAEQAADADGKRTKAESARIRRIALLNIAIQTATAIANGVASAMSVPFPGNLAAAATTIATVIGLMGQASALLGSAGSEGPESQNNPNWADNNLTLTGEKGIPALDGPSHAQGGLDVVDTATGRRVANIEGGEAVVNKEVTAKNPDVIDELMAAAHRPDKKVRTDALPPDEAGDTRSMAIPVKKQKNPGIDTGPGNDAPDATRSWLRMAYGGLFGMAIPTKKQRNPGLADPDEREEGAPDTRTMATGGLVGLAIPTKKQRNPGLADPDEREEGAPDTRRMANGGLVGLAIPTKKQRNPGLADPDETGADTLLPDLLARASGPATSTGGVFGGSLHRDGGNSVVDNRTGQVIAEVEKDEPWMVLSRAFREKNRDLIPTLLEASRRGLRVEHISTTPIPVPNPVRVAQAMRAVHYAQGGLFGMDIPSKKQKNPGATDEPTTNALMDAINELVDINHRMFDQNDQLIRRMGDVNESVQKFPKTLRAYTVLNKEHDRTVKQWEALKTRYSASA